MGHWEALGGHPGNMGPKRKRKGQYSIYTDHREPGRWRKKMMDKGRGPGRQRGLTIEQVLREMFEWELGYGMLPGSRLWHMDAGNDLYAKVGPSLGGDFYLWSVHRGSWDSEPLVVNQAATADDAKLAAEMWISGQR